MPAPLAAQDLATMRQQVFFEGPEASRKLMTPIQGTMLSVVTGDRANLARSIGVVVAGAAAAIAIGFVVGLLVPTDVVASTNSQVASRVSPKLIDLFAALATGVVGLARKDISDTLPGVAIAISPS